ncbi:hypothetical protein HMPREF9103_02021 [Lentilactobacillus parafarraginis F0439]|uniref:Uncharacterized protein n=1 Tax=Lentilactobacillus parafarraginis F0439 TaxID=797515 RepID=G9ZQL4_9LACO|nr:hypothetical protein HMPREF9103_02021 [Lentilactobacillus parafarraginis F0439]
MLWDLYYSDKEIAKYLSRDDLNRIMSPENVLPHAVEKTEKILRLYRQRNGSDMVSSH